MKVNNEILTVLSNAQTDGNALKLTGQLDRNTYQQVNKVIEAAGGKWNKKLKAHIFEGDAADAMEQILLTGEVTVPQNFGYFPTPEPIVRRLIDLAGIKPGMRVLEPSAGQGAIAQEVAKITDVDCIELLPKNVAILNNLNLPGMIYPGDFLKMPAVPAYDRIVMNPPFAKQDDIKHVLHALKFLKPNGKLVSVMSASILFRQNRLTADFRTLLDDCYSGVEELPEGAFKESGTMVRTVIVSILGAT
jgi:type I restriction-modification system DNA methylase subunit